MTANNYETMKISQCYHFIFYHERVRKDLLFYDFYYLVDLVGNCLIF